MPPYVGMARKQNGGYNASINVQTLIFHLVVNSTRLKTVRSARWCCPNYTMAPRLVENVVKVTNLEVVKIEFRHLPFLLSTFFSQPSALTRQARRQGGFGGFGRTAQPPKGPLEVFRKLLCWPLLTPQIAVTSSVEDCSNTASFLVAPVRGRSVHNVICLIQLTRPS